MKKTNVKEPAELLKLLQDIIINQQALANAMGVKLPIRIDASELTTGKAVPLKGYVLPKPLHIHLLYPNAFYRAFAEGLIMPDDNGKLIWTMNNKVLLAYFLGRLFCNDKAVYISASRTYIWEQTPLHYPDAELTDVFGFSVRTQRKNRNFLTAPKDFQIIDNLFVK